MITARGVEGLHWKRGIFIPERVCVVVEFDKRELTQIYKAVKILQSGEVLLGLDIDEETIDSILEKLSKRLDEESRDRINEQIERLVSEAMDFSMRQTSSEERFDFDREFGPNYPYSNTLKLLEEALEEGKDVQMEYYSASRREFTKRKVRPESIERRRGVPYLNAYCYLRNDDRVFKLGRIKTIRMVD
jgi:predicted DNA-binding transcriptional regulator YafY